MATAFAEPTTAPRPLAVRPPAATIECLCPFCGAFNSGVGRPCRSCGTEDTTAARAAAAKRVGPWFVLNARNPSAPGMSLPALLTMVRQGIVTHRSVIRGPATGQLWRLAGKVRGLSREFGQCYGCGGELAESTAVCPHCDRPQSLPADIDAPAAATGFVAADRRPPKDDLLTPADVAKAFSLGFNPAGAAVGSAAPIHAAPAAGPSLLDRLPEVAPRTLAMFGAGLVAVVGGVWLASQWVGRPPAKPTLAGTVALAAPDREPIARPMIAAPRPLAVRIAGAADVAPVVLARHVDRPPAEDAAMPAAANEPAAAAVEATDDDPKRLMAAGLAAEARGDYGVAVKQYEHLESLSSDQWPAGFKDRLKLARAAARGDND